MDYDRGNIPASYDAGRGYAPATIALWLDVIAQCLAGAPVSRVLDIGCGTGRYSGVLAARLRSRVIGIEPSAKMLAQARTKTAERVSYLRAWAECLPLADDSADMAFMSMVFHHFRDARQAVRECRRVLRKRGKVCLRAGTTEQIPTYPYVPFFGGSRSILYATLQSRRVIESIFRDAGFELVRYELVRSEVAPDWRTYAEKLAWRADSILAQLPDSEFEDGMRALRRHAASAAPGGPVVEQIDFFGFRSV